MDEVFDIVDEHDRVIGSALRSEVHGNPSLVHRVAHVLVFNSRGELFLQKRAANKDVAPNLWDTSVGGHLDRGETYAQAAYREAGEELGIAGVMLELLYKYPLRLPFESENVCAFRCEYNGKMTLLESEISDGRFWTLDEIAANIENYELFTKNFTDEFRHYCSWARAKGLSVPAIDMVPRFGAGAVL